LRNRYPCTKDAIGGGRSHQVRPDDLLPIRGRGKRKGNGGLRRSEETSESKITRKSISNRGKVQLEQEETENPAGPRKRRTGALSYVSREKTRTNKVCIIADFENHQRGPWYQPKRSECSVNKQAKEPNQRKITVKVSKYKVKQEQRAQETKNEENHK